jgi:hypothetical protein
VQHLPVFRTIGFAFRFSFQRLPSALLRMMVPALAGYAALYVLTSAYLGEIESFLSNPDPQGASLILGIASLAFFLVLFLDVVLRASLTAFVLELPSPGWMLFPTGHAIWRLYAANLRVMLIGLPVAAIVAKFGALPGRPTPLFAEPDYLSLPVLIDLLALLAFLYLSARVVFLMPSVALRERGSIVRRSWTLSRGNILRLIVISVLLSLVGLLVQVIVETVFQRFGALATITVGATLGEIVHAIQRNLPQLILSWYLGYLTNLLLLSIAGAKSYLTIAAGTSNPI